MTTYKSGDWNAICDSCGREFKASQLKRRWDGMMVCSEDYEQRHPQDFLRLRPDRISVPWVRPEVDVYGADIQAYCGEDYLNDLWNYIRP